MFANGLVRSFSALLMPILLWVMFPNCCWDAVKAASFSADCEETKSQVLEALLGAQVILLAMVCDYMLLSKTDAAADEAPAPIAEEKAASSLTKMGETTKCRVCMENPATYAAVPCGHKSFCEDCLLVAQKDRRSVRRRGTRHLVPLACIICRNPVKEYMRIWE
eukprot:gb/GFBE01063632.1/.p1 GENE.gb/GFBE01063632.1/~~gb/GFBE01063632.1/.p1  ORF type:complete len:164 (+),score=25.50 gb/GFBE01063632.1/:1-492(+)